MCASHSSIRTVIYSPGHWEGCHPSPVLGIVSAEESHLAWVSPQSMTSQCPRRKALHHIVCKLSLVLTGSNSEGPSSSRSPWGQRGPLLGLQHSQLFHTTLFVHLLTAVDPKGIPKKCLMYHIRIYFLRMLTFNLSPRNELWPLQSSSAEALSPGVTASGASTLNRHWIMKS